MSPYIWQTYKVSLLRGMGACWSVKSEKFSISGFESAPQQHWKVLFQITIWTTSLGKNSKIFQVDSSLKHVGQNVGHQRYLEENYGKRVRVSSKYRKEVKNLPKSEKWMNSSSLQVSVFKDNPVRQGIDRVSFFVMMKIKIMIFKMKMKTR